MTIATHPFNALMEINRASVPNSDKLVSSLSTITYGGTLTVTNIGASLHVGQGSSARDGWEYTSPSNASGPGLDEGQFSGGRHRDGRFANGD